jgi:hypothetical protein
MKENKMMLLDQEEINVMQEALLRYSNEDIESDEFYSEEEVQKIKNVRDALLKRSGVEG